MADVTNKAELLASIARERARLEALVGGLSEGQLEDRSFGGDWSVRDVLAHTSAWERRIERALRTALGGTLPPWPEEGATLADVDRLNARDAKAGRERPLAEVLAESRASYEAIRALVASMSEEDLFGTERWAWSRGHAAAEFVQANTDEHYAEHAAEIEAWLGADSSEI